MEKNMFFCIRKLNQNTNEVIQFYEKPKFHFEQRFMQGKSNILRL